MVIFAFATCSLFGLVIVSYMHANILGVSFHMKMGFYVINFCVNHSPVKSVSSSQFVLNYVFHYFIVLLTLWHLSLTLVFIICLILLLVIILQFPLL